jgi:hypothetical protein
MKIEWEIAPRNIQSVADIIRAQGQGYKTGYSEICWATVSLRDKSGQIYSFGNVAAANLFVDLMYFFGQNKAKEFVKEHVSDANQSYGFKLEKEGAALTMKLPSPSYAHPKILHLDFEMAHSKTRYFSRQFLDEYLRVCPTLNDYVYLDALRREFDLR